MTDTQLIAGIIALVLVVAIFAVLLGVSRFALAAIPTKPAAAEKLLLEAEPKPLSIGTEAEAEKATSKEA